MAYAAIISLVQTLEHIRIENQILQNKQQMESLLEKVSFLQSFLQDVPQKSNTQVKILETQIRDAVLETEDIIDSHVSNQFLSICECCVDRDFTIFFHELQKAIDRIDCIKSEVMEFRDTCFNNLQPKNYLSSKPSIFSSGNNAIVGFVDEVLEIKDRLTGPPSNKLEILSIFGMGGSGKTTLARNIYEDAFIQYHFDIRAWITVSQEYDEREVLLGLLKSSTNLTTEICEKDTEELAEYLYKSLKGSRYLIVMDDMWEMEVWDSVKRLFPNDMNGSRIMLTTRILDVALYANSNLNPPFFMRFLHKNESWNLLQEKVFEEERCPRELEAVGIEIAQSCNGLPLAILLVGGLLNKVHRSLDQWRNIAKNIKAIMTTQNDQCLEILSLSYNHLPHHLKPCFLYMGIFPEDYQIPVSKLIWLWAAEGFLDSGNGEIVEDVGERYLKDLIDRSLVLVGNRKFSGKITTCSIHDLVRDLCVREARKEKFLHVMKGYDDLWIPEGTQAQQRRLSIHSNVLYVNNASYRKDLIISLSDDRLKRIYDSIILNPVIRSLIFTGSFRNPINICLGFRLLKVLDAFGLTFVWFPPEVVELVYLRYLALTFNGEIPASLSNLQNLKILVVNQAILGTFSYLPSEIWAMSQLRHLKFKEMFFPDYPVALFYGKKVFRLDNLQTLSGIRNFRLTEDVLMSIPNLKKLRIMYNKYSETEDWSFYCLNNLVYLHQLETLTCEFRSTKLVPSSLKPNLLDLSFPSKLKKLTLRGWKLSWEDMAIIGSLHNLETLKLQYCAFQGPVWELFEGEFCRLKVLLLENINLVSWRAETDNFPNLERLILKFCKKLEEIPSSFGDIPTLKLIVLISCRPSCVSSAKQLLEDQQNLGNDDLKVLIQAKPLPVFKISS